MGTKTIPRQSGITCRKHTRTYEPKMTALLQLQKLLNELLEPRAVLPAKFHQISPPG